MCQSKKSHKLFDLMTKITIIVFTLLFVFSKYTFSGEVINISNSPNWKSTYPRIAVDPGDRVHVVWIEKYSDNQGDLFYSSSDAHDPQLDIPLNLSNSSKAYSETLRSCDIDVDDSSNIYATWIEDRFIKLRIFFSGEWGSSFEVASSQEGLDKVSIAVSPVGNIYMVWWSDSGVVFSRARVNNVWEDTKRISTSGKRSKFPNIAVGNHRVYSCWSQKNQDLDIYEIAYASRETSLSSSWSSVQEVHPNDLSQSHPSVSVNSMGVPYVIWTSYINGNRVVHGSPWTGSGFSSPFAISTPRLLHYASLFEQYGDLYVCWQVGGYEAGLAIFYNQYQNGSWSDEKAVAQSDGSTFSDISASPDAGKMYVTWDSNGEIYFTYIDSTPISNIPPVAEFNFSPQTGIFPLKVTFDASSSHDPDGQIVQYSWDFGDNATALGKIVEHTYEQDGTFSISLSVKDNKGAVDIETKTIDILLPNESPVAEFNFSPQTGIFPLKITFDASSSHDPDGQIVQYSWDFGDNATALGKIATHTYESWGAFTITLSIEDNRGDGDTKTDTIEVLRLFQPLNIRWETFNDDSMFLTRYITNVKWEKNPNNNKIVEVILYRIYRKENHADPITFKYIGEVDAQLFTYDDYDIDEKDKYSYTVTSVDSQGHESPIDYSSSDFKKSKKSQRIRILKQ